MCELAAIVMNKGQFRYTELQNWTVSSPQLCNRYHPIKNTPDIAPPTVFQKNRLSLAPQKVVLMTQFAIIGAMPPGLSE
jgi:hypothetical protein